MGRSDDHAAPTRVGVPADVDRPDRLLAGLTARQLSILAATALGLWLVWALVHTVVPTVVCLAGAGVIAAVVFAVVVGRRDGVSMDVWLLHALRHHRSATCRVSAPEGVPAAPRWIRAQPAPGLPAGLPAPLRPPARGIDEAGLIDLGGDGQVGVAEADTVNFALRTASEQDALVAAFAGWLHALDGPTQILVRAERADLSHLAAAVTATAPHLPDPRLEAAALDHAAFLTELGSGRDLLRRRLLICLRDTGRTGAAGRWVDDSIQALAAAEVTARPVHGADALHLTLTDTTVADTTVADTTFTGPEGGTAHDR